MNQLRIGTGRSNITPAPGTPQGIWGAQTHERGVDSDLPLYATALAISDSRQTALIIDVDAIGFNAEWSDKILDAVAAMTRVPRDHIRVAASHTHSGPKTQRLEVITEGLEMAVEYLETLPLRIAGAAWQAINNLKPARVAAGTGECAINVNRRLELADGRMVVGRNWDGPVDHTVRVVRFDDLEEQPIATIVHYACHPTIMAWDNQWFTPELPPSISIRCPRPRAASTNTTSFIRSRACNGVFVRVSRTTQLSRPAASKLAIMGGATVRFQ